jgi:hypothetical protein
MILAALKLKHYYTVHVELNYHVYFHFLYIFRRFIKGPHNMGHACINTCWCGGKDSLIVRCDTSHMTIPLQQHSAWLLENVVRI